MELVLAGGVGRRTAFAAAMTAVAITVVVLWLAEFAGFALAGLPLGGSAYLALATVSIAPVCAGVGAAGQPARALPPAGARARRGGRRPALPAAGDRRHRGRPGLAALGDAARVGRAAAALRRRAPARARASAARHGAAADGRVAPRGGARHRHGNPRLSRQRRPASGVALLSARADAAQRARAAWRSGWGALAPSPTSSACSPRARSSAGISQNLNRTTRQAGQRDDRHPDRLSRLRLHLLHPDREPLRLCPGRRRQARGGRRAPRDAAGAAGGAAALARRSASAGCVCGGAHLARAPGCWPGPGPSPAGRPSPCQS